MRQKPVVFQQHVWTGLLLAYAVAMLYVWFIWRFLHKAADNGYGSMNLVPGRSILHYIRAAYLGWQLKRPFLVRYAVVNFWGNLLLLLPAGVLLPLRWKQMQRFGCFFITVMLCVAFVEGLQWWSSLGSCDVDDLLLNLVGACGGFALWRTACEKTGK